MLFRLILISLLLFSTTTQSHETPTTNNSIDIQSIPAGQYVNDPGHTSVTFRISHLGFSLYTGRFNTMEAALFVDPNNLSKTRIQGTVPIQSIDTNSQHLDKKVQGTEYFDSSQYAQAAFVGTCLQPTGPNTAKLTGYLSMKGVSKHVEWDVTLTGAGIHPFSKKYTIGFQAETTIKRSDWGILALIPVIGDEVHLSIAIEFNKTD